MSPQGYPIPVTPPPLIHECKMVTEEQLSTKENKEKYGDTLPPNTSTCSSVPCTISSPLLHSQRKRPCPISPTASSTGHTLRSAGVAAKLSAHADEQAKSWEPMVKRLIIRSIGTFTYSFFLEFWICVCLGEFCPCLHELSCSSFVKLGLWA